MSEILVKVSRGPLVENIIRGNIVVLDPSGHLLAHCGDAQKVCYMRSAAKPLQAASAVERGIMEAFSVTPEELAVMCGSHNGEDFHVRVIASILQKIGLDESYLQCGTDYSINQAIREKRIGMGIEKRSIYNNCSGKHAAMLALCVKEGFDVRKYYLPEHPVQQIILHGISEYTGIAEEDIVIGVDGCGVPVFGLPLYNMALSYMRLANPCLLPEHKQAAASRITAAMTSYPLMVAGTGDFCTSLMEVTHGRIIGKMGADGVFCSAVKNGDVALAVKIEDGNMTALAPVVLRTYLSLGAITEREYQSLKHFAVREVFNCLGEKVGEIKADFSL